MCSSLAFKKRRSNLPQSFQFGIFDVFALVLGETEQKDRSFRSKANQETKSTALAFTRSGNALLDDLTSEVGINQTTHRSLDGGYQAGISDAILSRELRQGPGLENAHKASLSLYKL